ncbi:MAG: Ubiquinone/menaquinone biosynthesis C-methyltransferase UbiE [Phycisphaerales bacterium]|nr:Ubiquinone/menaquinone biosynthesis C-methyltransferase UbiE [Phycisphaerales bacterium]MCK6475589.1 methyltransferase domain-containing protein [Phycisphaerales bacterium]
MATTPAFSGSVPQTYHTFLGPLIFDAYARDMAQRLGVREGERVLELACGTGIVTEHLARSLPQRATLIATDVSDGMLGVARSVVRHPSVEFKQADACTLPFEDRSFDSLAAQYGVMFFADKVKAMQEARRVLKPGGRYVFNVWDSLEHNPLPRIVHDIVCDLFPTDPPGFLAKLPYGWNDRAEIERVVRAGGFERCTIETVGFPSEAPTADHVARGFVEGTPLSSQLAERGADPARVSQTAARALAERFGEKPCRSTMRAVVVTAS